MPTSSTGADYKDLINKPGTPNSDPFNYLELSQTPTDPAGVAKMVWNDTDGTIEFQLKGGNVTLQIGQEEVSRVVNKTGADLLEANYQAVRVRLVSEGGAAGQRLAVVLAQADTTAHSGTIIGIVTETILNNQEGFITTGGEVHEINTTGSLQGETWVDGDILYLSPTVAGGITNIKPTAPSHMVTLGYVVYSHAVHGKIYVKTNNGYELDELHDVAITSPATNDILKFNGSNLWVNAKPPIINKQTTTDGTAVTGTTLSTATASLLIPANTVAVGDVLNFKTRLRKTGTAGTVIIRVYFNTTGIIGGSLVAASTTAASTSLFVQMSRTFAVKTTTNTESYPSGIGATIDEGITGTAVTASNINWAVDQYLVIALQNSNNADNSRSSFVHLQINKA